MNSIPISGSGMIDLLICQPNLVDFESACDTGWEVTGKYVLYERWLASGVISVAWDG